MDHPDLRARMRLKDPTLAFVIARDAQHWYDMHLDAAYPTLVVELAEGVRLNGGDYDLTSVPCTYLATLELMNTDIPLDEGYGGHNCRLYLHEVQWLGPKPKLPW